jgi:hypothetical protein
MILNLVVEWRSPRMIASGRDRSLTGEGSV